jgi:hypothetical protein
MPFPIGGSGRRSSRARDEKGFAQVETFCTQLEMSEDFCIFSRNPLKIPIRTNFVRDLRNINDLSGR